MSAEPSFETTPRPDIHALPPVEKEASVAPSYEVYTGKQQMHALNEKSEVTNEYNIVRRALPFAVRETQGDQPYRTLPLAVRDWEGTGPEVKWINNGLEKGVVKKDFGFIRADDKGTLYLENGEGLVVITPETLKEKPAFLPLDKEQKVGILIRGYNKDTGEVDMQRGWQEEEKAPVAPLPPIRQIEDYRPQPTPPVERNDAPKAPTQENEKKSPLRYLVDIAPAIGLGLGTIHGGPATISQTLHEVPQNPIPVIERPDPREPHEVPSAQIVDTRLNTVHDNEPLMATGDVLPQDPTSVTPKPFTPAPEPTPAIIPDVPSTGGGFAADVRGQIEENAANAAAQSQRFIERGNADAQNWNNQPPVTPADNTK